ncbi:MAG: hypothetical protein R2705_06910 [Ilumatobacteraceae bacterium]
MIGSLSADTGRCPTHGTSSGSSNSTSTRSCVRRTRRLACAEPTRGRRPISNSATEAHVVAERRYQDVAFAEQQRDRRHAHRSPRHAQDPGHRSPECTPSNS